MTVWTAAGARDPHDGSEATLLAPYHRATHRGSIIVTPGYTCPAGFGAGGNPSGTPYASGEGNPPAEAQVAAARARARVVAIAGKLRSESQAG
jgi:NAD(P)H dehydrogenase (quinone)